MTDSLPFNGGSQRFAMSFAVAALALCFSLPDAAASPCLVRTTESRVLQDASTRYQPLSQKDPRNYRDPALRTAVDTATDGTKQQVENLACLATVYVMLERGREGGRADAKIDDFYVDPRPLGGNGKGAIRPTWVQPDADLQPTTVVDSLNRGLPVILHGQGGPRGDHFVLAVKTELASGGSPQVVAFDPWPTAAAPELGQVISIGTSSNTWVHPTIPGLKFRWMRTVTLPMAPEKDSQPPGSVSSPKDLTSVVARGLQTSFNTLWVPRGDIVIMSGMASVLEESSPKNRRYRDSYLAELAALRARGLVTFVEQKPKNEMEIFARAGERTFTVTPTPEALKLCEQGGKNESWVVLNVGQCEVVRIVKNDEFKHPMLADQASEHRIVVGVYRRSVTPAGRLLSSALDGEFRFQAVVKKDPITDHFDFLEAKWGPLEKNEWSSQPFVPTLKPARQIDEPTAQRLDAELRTAIQAADDTAVKALLEQGADPNRRDPNGLTPLWNAICNMPVGTAISPEKLQILRTLLARGADPNVEESDRAPSDPKARGMTPWLTALNNSDAKIIEVLLEFGADPNAPLNAGRRPLGLVSTEEAAAALIAKGADVNGKDSDGSTALHGAPFIRTGCVKLLIAKGANVNAVDRQGSTPLHVAAVYGADEPSTFGWGCDSGIEIVDVLLAAGASLNAKDRKGLTPLGAVKKRHGSTEKSFKRGDNGPVQVDVVVDRSKMIEYLLSKGAKE